MKKSKTGIILVAVFLIGVCVLLYPTLADYWNQKHQTAAIADMEKILATMDEDEFLQLFEDAERYNRELGELKYPMADWRSVKGYKDTLNPLNTGMMGYITISRINVELPIYHGTSDSVLGSAVGHIEGTSLPIGGEGTHSALSAHRGLPSAKLFTHLDQLEKGDIFVIKVLNRVCTYEVDKISIVTPDEINDLVAVPGEDYCTLVTCTPYGINSHRLLVRGTRIENVRPPLYVTTQAFQIDSLLATPAVAAPILLVLFIVLMVKYRKPTGKKYKVEEIAYEEIKDE